MTRSTDMRGLELDPDDLEVEFGKSIFPHFHIDVPMPRNTPPAPEFEPSEDPCRSHGQRDDDARSPEGRSGK